MQSIYQSGGICREIAEKDDSVCHLRPFLDGDDDGDDTDGDGGNGSDSEP